MKSQPRPHNSYSKSVTRAMAWMVIVISPFLVVFAFSKTAHAGLLSFMGSIFGSEQVSANIRPPASTLNTQTLSLLSAHSNINPVGDIADETNPVVSGDTLSADIAEANASTTDGSATISTYTVQSGDTLSKIAQMFNVSVNTIVWANNISRSTPLQAGQVLIILPVSGINYTVKKGDTIKGIVAKYKADIDEVLRFNDLSLSSTLVAGQSIIIPDAELSTESGPVQRTTTSHGRITKAPYEPLLDGWQWPAMPGYFINPLPGGTKTQGLHGHNAVDLAAPIGSAIHASAAGIVIIARTGGWNGGYGSFVVISHPNGTQTLYAHMSRVAVSPGESVLQSQTIGYVGVTGLTTGPHVHFEIRGAQNPF